ncbi:hypothetical protein BS50DRAFT_574522 [Corynespora cassiicola Philippines]|uniref:Uncharacterized protein n=1 Tax=Corynespora cassiicola Philippines TaxID=1448308 RepID=A0A2T2NKU9_CORCC|nr:hypothetical protein BS50DRAFT_574522 [Corynespora cassiicola Philippines]
MTTVPKKGGIGGIPGSITHPHSCPSPPPILASAAVTTRVIASPPPRSTASSLVPGPAHPN